MSIQETISRVDMERLVDNFNRGPVGKKAKLKEYMLLADESKAQEEFQYHLYILTPSNSGGEPFYRIVNRSPFNYGLSIKEGETFDLEDEGITQDDIQSLV